MRPENLTKLQLFSFCCLLPGLFGLALATCVSTRYMDTLPRYPDPEHERMVPRNISGYVIYQTDEEARRLDVVEYSSIGVFSMGLIAGLVYLQQWGIVRAIEAEDDEFAPEEG